VVRAVTVSRTGTMVAVPARRQAALTALARRMLIEVDDLVTRMGDAYRAEIPEYAALTPGELEAEVLPISRRAVTSFFSAFLNGRRPGSGDLRAFEDSGRVRLVMGVPLDSVLHAYRVAGRVTWDAVVANIRPGEEVLLGDLAGGWIEFIDRASCLVARGYLAASHERMRHVDARRRELLEALLSATDPADVAAVALRFSTVLSSTYVPVVVGSEGAAGRIDALLDASRPGTLGGHRGNRVLLLVPEPLTGVAELHLAGGGPLAYGRPARPGEDLVAAVREAEQLADIAAREYGGTGVYGPDDLLIEQLLLAAPRVTSVLRRRVCDVLSRRDPSGTLEATLRAYLSCGSVPETARSLVVHPNTVSYRLARIRELVDLDPRVPRQAVLLVLALGLKVPGDEPPVG
jgi:PucR C-terminal helix-turn-helix domain